MLRLLIERSAYRLGGGQPLTGGRIGYCLVALGFLEKVEERSCSRLGRAGGGDGRAGNGLAAAALVLLRRSVERHWNGRFPRARLILCLETGFPTKNVKVNYDLITIFLFVSIVQNMFEISSAGMFTMEWEKMPGQKQLLYYMGPNDLQ